MSTPMALWGRPELWGYIMLDMALAPTRDAVKVIKTIELASLDRVPEKSELAPATVVEDTEDPISFSKDLKRAA